MLLWLARWLRMGAGLSRRVTNGVLWGRDEIASDWESETVSSAWGLDPSGQWSDVMPSSEWSKADVASEWATDDEAPLWGRDDLGATWTEDAAMPVIKDLTIYPGEDVEIPYTPRDSPATDITGWTIKMYVRRQARTGSVLFTADGVITTAASGLFKMPLSQAQTLRLPGDYCYDVWRIDAGFNRLLATGKLTLGEVARFASELSSS